MNKSGNNILASKAGWLILLVLLTGVNFLASVLHARMDLTREKRYTLSKATARLVKKLEEPLTIDVFLKGEFPSGFRKLAETTKEFLSLLKEKNSAKIRYRFISPLDKMEDDKTIYGDSLVGLGAVPINLTVQKRSGESSNIIFPVAVINYKGRQMLVNLYPGASSRISQDEINSAEALMEYQFVNALDKITSDVRPMIAYATGNGEPTDGRVFDLAQTIQKDYDFFTFDLGKQPVIPSSLNALVIVKPTEQFTEEEKLKLDQFVMQGGKLLCFIDNLIAEQDSLALKPETIAYDRNLNLTDLFFRYGLRINTDLVMDLQCDVIPFVVGGTRENPQMEFLHWNYYPFFSSSGRVTRTPGYIASKFANSIDTINVSGVKKTPLLVSSPNSRIISTPALISLNENKNVPEDEKFKRNAIPVAMLLEGKFTSLFRNRITRSQVDSLKAHETVFQASSPENKMIVVADGDIVLNDFIPSGGANSAPAPIQMGWNKYTYTEYLKQTERATMFFPAANRDFFLNCIEYLISNPAISETRNKDIVLRLLDSKKVDKQKMQWQLINIVLPVLLVLLFGWIYQELRKRKYS
jgi:gliding-associated putative ABC transporter substrate-binding component GldG